MRKLIYAVDFDNTLAKTNYPTIISPIWETINYCKEKQKEGHILILWTCREKEDLNSALSFCNTVGLHFDYVNENASERIALYKNDCRKIGADYYIDDKAINSKDLEGGK